MVPLRRSILPEPLQADLRTLGAALERSKIPTYLDRTLAALGALPSAAIARAEGDIACSANLNRRSTISPPGRHWGLPTPWARRGDLELLMDEPLLAFLFLFHRDGWVREAALASLDADLPTAFWVAAVAFRLNDWVPPVRAAAVACAHRTFPRTDPGVMAAAALALLGRKNGWRRWGAEREAFEAGFARPAVADALAHELMRAAPGPRAAILREALRSSFLDRHLMALGRDALLPTVRVEAMRTLIDGRARWPVGYAYEWIDKSHGLRRRVRAFGERPVKRPDSLQALVAIAAGDPSPLVRRLAADAMIRHRAALANRAELMRSLVGDRSRAVRERIAYLARSGGPEGLDAGSLSGPCRR